MARFVPLSCTGKYVKGSWKNHNTVDREWARKRPIIQRKGNYIVETW
jgi:hypothetical protein